MTSVVIVGSGFTGFECARRLGRTGSGRSDVDVTIISPVDYMLYTPLLPDVAGGVVDARFVAIPLAGTLKGVRAIRGRVDRVDLKEQHRAAIHRSRTPHPRAVLGPVGTDSRIGDPSRRYSWIGAVHKGFEVGSRGACIFAITFWSNWSCPAWKRTPNWRRARRTIVVVGASYSGTELVLQLRALANAAAKQMNFDPAAVRVRAARPRRAGDAGGRREVRSPRDSGFCGKRGVDVRLGLTLNEVHPGHVVLSDKSRVNAHTVAWVTGVTAAPLIETLGPADR